MYKAAVNVRVDCTTKGQASACGLLARSKLHSLHFQPKYTYKMLLQVREEELLQVLDSLSKVAAISIHMKHLQQFHENNHAQASANNVQASAKTIL